jgi:predicted metal-binding protein
VSENSSFDAEGGKNDLGCFASSSGALAPATQPSVDDGLLFICRTCPRPEEIRSDRPAAGSGLRIAEALEAGFALNGAPLVMRRVECLSGCRRPCNVRFSGRGKASYWFHVLKPSDAADIDAFARLYATSADGCVEDNALPSALKQALAAKIPPQRSGGS